MQDYYKRDGVEVMTRVPVLLFPGGAIYKETPFTAILERGGSLHPFFFQDELMCMYFPFRPK